MKTPFFQHRSLYFTQKLLYFTKQREYTIMVHLGNNVARLRGFRRLTQKQVADKANMTQQEYSRLESRQVIDDDLLERIAAAIEFPVDLIKQLDSASVVNNNQQGGNAGNIFYQNENADHVKELYDMLLQQKEEIIKMKDEVIRQKDEIIEMYKKQQKAS